MKSFIEHDDFKQLCIELAEFRALRKCLNTADDGSLFTDKPIDNFISDGEVEYQEYFQELFDEEYDFVEGELNRIGIYSKWNVEYSMK